jgi:hypothetical protein
MMPVIVRVHTRGAARKADTAASPEGQVQVQDALTEEDFKVPVRSAIL